MLKRVEGLDKFRLFFKNFIRGQILTSKYSRETENQRETVTQQMIPPKRFDLFSPRLGDAQKV